MTTSDAPPTAPVAVRIPRWLAWTWVVGGLVGMLATAVACVVGISLVRNTTDASIQGLAVADGVLDTVADTVELLDTTFADVASSLDTVEESVRDATDAMAAVGATLDEVTALVTEDVPASIESVNDAMPQLIATMGVVDTAMSGLSFLGVDYDREAPLDEALAAVSDRLARIPPELRGQRDALDDVVTRLDDIAGQGDDVAADLARVRDDLAASRDLLDDYRSSVREADVLADDLVARLQTQATTATWALVVLAITVVIGHTVPVVLGLHVLRSGAGPGSTRRSTAADRAHDTPPSSDPAPTDGTP